MAYVYARREVLMVWLGGSTTSVETISKEEHWASDRFPYQDDKHRLQYKTGHNALCAVWAHLAPLSQVTEELHRPEQHNTYTYK